MLRWRRLLDSLPLFWLLLAVPGVAMAVSFVSGEAIAMDLLHPSGEFSARLIIVALAISPLIALFGQRRWLGWLQRRRRSLGVAAFGYAVLHMIFYLFDLGSFRALLAEIDAAGIWTGWVAFALLVPLAVTSNQAAMRALRRGWKRLQRLAYPAALFTLAHWLLIHDGAAGAILHFAPLAILELIRVVRLLRRSAPGNPPRAMHPATD